MRSNGEGGTSAFSDLGRACGPAAMAQTAHWNLRSAQPSRCSKVEDLRVGIQGAGREGEQVGVLCTSRKSGRVAFKAMAISSGPCRTFQTRPSVVAIQRPKIRIVAGQTGTLLKVTGAMRAVFRPALVSLGGDTHPCPSRDGNEGIPAPPRGHAAGFGTASDTRGCKRYRRAPENATRASGCAPCSTRCDKGYARKGLVPRLRCGGYPQHRRARYSESCWC